VLEVPGRSAAALKTWLADHTAQFRPMIRDCFGACGARLVR
jgi:hypothetical protein